MAQFVLLACSAVVLLAAVAHGHGGALHPYPGTPEGRNDIRTRVGTCSKWVPVSRPVAQLVDANATSSKYDVNGTILLLEYLSDNCTNAHSGSMEVKLTFSQNRQPVENLTVMGYAHTGSCASGSDDIYLFNRTLGEVKYNMLWFYDGVTPENGTLWGHGVNDGYIVTKAPNGVSSVTLYNNITEAPIACCDFQLAGPRDTNWTATLDGKGNSSCPTEEDDSHAAHGAAAGMHGMEDMEGMNHTDHTGHNHSDHAGHDHSGHDHSAMGNATRAASGAANGTASALANGTRAASSGAALSTSWVSMAVAGAVILLAAALA
eukprot:jgi/Chrzof1/10348/Cz04g38220.t1